jgi:hypothetical protein
MAGVEAARRLAPTRDTVRRLFALSGNRCAFPSCPHPLIDAHGNFVAEVCHIEAAEFGGPRFNPAMTNEDRRLPSNLLLLCHRHHVETDDEERFPVAELRRLKERHEAHFEEAVTQIAESLLEDITKRLSIAQPQTLEHMREVLNWGVTSEQLHSALVEMLCPMLERLRSLTPETRSVLLVVVERGTDSGDDLSCPLHEIEQVTRANRQTLLEHAATLTRYGIASVSSMEEHLPSVSTNTLDGWSFWRDLREFCYKTGREPREFVLDLRFDLLD